MAVTINASTSSGLVQSADNSGILQLQTASTTALTIDASQNTTLAGSLTVSGSSINPVTRATQQATTSGSSFNFPNIPSWVKRISVIFNGVSVSGTDSIIIQLGDSGGIETTGYISSSTATGGSTATTSSTSGFIIRSSIDTNVISGIVDIINITGNTWVAAGAVKLSTTANAYTGGDKSLSDTLTQLTITVTGTNTFDAGAVNILYQG